MGSVGGALVLIALVLTNLGLLSGCGTSNAESERRAQNDLSPASSISAGAPRTEQVVQHALPAPAESAPVAPPSAVSASPSTARAAPHEPGAPRKAAISSKHLEAELNRLEAELGR